MRLFLLAGFLCSAVSAFAQSIDLPWSGHGRDPQHTGISRFRSQSLGRIKWSMPVDLNRQYTGDSLLIHYGTPLITRQNTVLVPVKTGPDDGFRIEARQPADGATKWTITSDYTLPSHNWVPPFGMALTPKNRLCFPGIGGSVRYRDSPDATTGETGQLFFYGAANYQADPAAFDSYVKINTPITSDRYGNIFFGFVVISPGPTNPNLESGLARIAEDGTGAWISAKVAAADMNMVKLVHNCAPALSNDQKTLYFAVSSGDFGSGYLVSIDSRTLAPIARVRLKDAMTSENALLSDDGSASPTIGPDGDVYFGVLENPYISNDLRGYLLHFNAALTQSKPAGGFGWDDTASIVPAALVPSYTGSSAYLLLTKYNDYAGYGNGQGLNRLAVLDPNATTTSTINGATVMQEVITILSPTPDPMPAWPDGRREWCINMAVIDPATKSAIVSCEDGKLYRWNFAANALSEVITLTPALGEAYTPTLIGEDGTIYSIANGTLYAIGDAAP